VHGVTLASSVCTAVQAAALKLDFVDFRRRRVGRALVDEWRRLPPQQTTDLQKSVRNGLPGCRRR